MSIAVAAIGTIVQVASELEAARGYWDESGLDMHIAIKQDGRVAVSSKHWARTHYIRTRGKTVQQLWQALRDVATRIGRSLVRSKYGPYVYVPKLNVAQTQDVFDRLKQELDCHDIEREWEFSWRIDDAVIIYSDAQEEASARGMPEVARADSVVHSASLNDEREH